MLNKSKVNVYQGAKCFKKSVSIKSSSINVSVPGFFLLAVCLVFIIIFRTAALTFPVLLSLLLLEVQDHAFHESLFSMLALLSLRDLKNIII